MADSQEKMIEQFCAIAGVDSERSKFFLESAAWNIEAALGSFYEEAEDIDTGIAIPEDTSPDKPEPKGPDMPRVNMFDMDSSDDEGQAFYAGGSEHSGQQVIGPSKKKKDVVSKLFKSAKDHGAEVLESKDGRGSEKKKLTFAGTGYRLGETEEDHEVVAGTSKISEQPKDVVLKMWKTGFTVDGGPLRQYDDPANHDFLTSVRRGQVPTELVKRTRGGEVFINMEDHRHEDYVPEKVKIVAFSGSGQSLGSPAPTVIGQVPNTGTPGGSSIRTPVGDSAASFTSLEEKAKEQLNLEKDKPTTNIQLRLPDGSRLILKLNHSHTVGDIRRYAATVRPQLPQTFAIMTTFPHAELTEDSKTVTEANILNAALIIK